MSQTHSDSSKARPLRLGILGASRVVDLAITGRCDGLFELHSVAARDEGRARRFAEERGIRHSFGSYEALLDDPDLEVVYVALPCSEHMRLTAMALERGKPVLCEKPFALDLESAREVLELAAQKNMLLMEAHHWRYHPLVEVLEREFFRVGALHRIKAHFVVGIDDPGDIRRNPALGAGVSMDFGCYLLQWARFVAARAARPETAKVESAIMVQVENQIDNVADYRLRFGEVEALLHCDMRPGTPFRAFVRAEGEEGVLHFENPLGVEDSELRLETLSTHQVWQSPRTSTYRRQLEALHRALSFGNAVPTSGEDTLETQRLLDAVYREAGLRSRRALAEEARLRQR